MKSLRNNSTKSRDLLIILKNEQLAPNLVLNYHYNDSTDNDERLRLSNEPQVYRNEKLKNSQLAHSSTGLQTERINPRQPYRFGFDACQC